MRIYNRPRKENVKELSGTSQFQILSLPTRKFQITTHLKKFTEIVQTRNASYSTVSINLYAKAAKSSSETLSTSVVAHAPIAADTTNLIMPPNASSVKNTSVMNY